MMNPYGAVTQALRGTQETIRYIGSDISANKRRLAESKLLTAQMDYKKAALESDIEFKDQQRKLLKLKVDEWEKDISDATIGETIDTFLIGLPADQKQKIMGSFTEEQLNKPYRRKDLIAAYKGMVERFTGQVQTLTPEEKTKAGFQPGDVVQKGIGGKLDVVRKAPIIKPASASQMNRMDKLVIEAFMPQIKAIADKAIVEVVDVIKNPAAYASEMQMGFFNKVKEAAFKLKKETPTASDREIVRKAKETVSREYGEILLSNFLSIENTEERKTFAQDLDPFASKIFKEAAGRYDKKNKKRKSSGYTGQW